MSLAIAGMLLLISSTLLYMVEGDGQPDAFGSHPAGHVVVDRDADHRRLRRRHSRTRRIGKILAGLTAITGIGLIAMPTGILASAFSDALQRQREAREKRGKDAEARLEDHGAS